VQFFCLELHYSFNLLVPTQCPVRPHRLSEFDYAIDVFPLTLFCSATQGRDRRRHDRDWAMRIPWRYLAQFRFLLSVIQHHHAYVFMPRQPCANRKHIQKLPACCTFTCFRLSTSNVITFPQPPSVVDSRRPLFIAAFRSSVARSRNAWKHGQQESDVGRDGPTAASSTGIAPFAILCLPSLGLLANGLIAFVPSCCSRSLRHSSSVATYPSSSAKNLCRRIALMRSRARLVNQPSRS
jgi:hypothetical protein